MPLEYIKETAHAYAYDSFDNKRRSGLLNVFIVNTQLDFRSSRDLHPLSQIRCLPEEVLNTMLSSKAPPTIDSPRVGGASKRERGWVRGPAKVPTEGPT
jgi:hypothetical protein